MKKIAMTLALLAGLPLALSADVTKEDLKKLAGAGVSDDVILSYVKANGPVVRLSAADIVELKQAGASEKLLAAVLTSTPAPAPAAPAARTSTNTYTAPAASSYAYDSTPYYYSPSAYYSDYSPYYYPTYAYPYYGPWFGVGFSFGRRCGGWGGWGGRVGVTGHIRR